MNKKLIDFLVAIVLQNEGTLDMLAAAQREARGQAWGMLLLWG
jgi:hypothetical protein